MRDAMNSLVNELRTITTKFVENAQTDDIPYIINRLADFLLEKKRVDITAYLSEYKSRLLDVDTEKVGAAASSCHNELPLPQCVQRIPEAMSFLQLLKKKACLQKHVHDQVISIVYNICEQLMEEHNMEYKLPTGVFMSEVIEHLEAEKLIHEYTGDDVVHNQTALYIIDKLLEYSTITYP